MAGIERDNPALKGVLPKDYARPGLDKQRLGQLVDLITNIRVGNRDARAKDVLGRVYDPWCGSAGGTWIWLKSACYQAMRLFCLLAVAVV